MKNTTKTKSIDSINPTELKALFSSVDWAANLNEEDLYTAILRSSHIALQFDEQSKLIGIARSMDDGIYSANIDIVVVHKDYHGKGVATKLLTDLLAQIKDVQYISVSPEIKNKGLYEHLGFEFMEDCILLQKININ